MPPQLRLLENKETGEQGLWNPETESFFDPQDYRVIQHKRSGQQALFDSTNQSIVAFLPSRVEGYKHSREVFRHLMKTDPSFAQLPLEERSKFLMGAEEKPSIMEPIMGTAKAIPEAIVGIGKAAYETGKAIISPPPVAVRPTETIEEAKARRPGLVGRAVLRGATLGLVGEEKEPLLPEEERLAHAAEFISAAVPFGGAIKTGERLAHLARAPRLLGAAVGGGAAASVGAPPGQRVEQFGVGAGVVGSLAGAFGLAGHLFRRLKGREPTSRAEVVEAIREEPAFEEALKEEQAKGATEQTVIPEAEGREVPRDGLKPKAPLTPEEQAAPDLSQLSPTELIKKGFGEETGQVGQMTPEQQATARAARQARQEIYRRVREVAGQTGKTIFEAAQELGISRKTAIKIARQYRQQRDVTETPQGFEPKFDAGVAINRTREVIEQREAFKRALTEGPPELPPKGEAKTPKSYVTKLIEETMPDLPFGETAKIETDKSRAGSVLLQVGYPVEEMLKIIGGEKPWPTKTEFLKRWDNHQWWVGIELAQKNEGYFRKFGLKTAALSERFSSGVEYADAMREIDAKQRSSGLRLASEIIPEKPVPSKAPLTPEEQAAPDLSQLSPTELIKKGFGEETGQVGQMTPEQQATARAARQARQEIYRRVREVAGQTGKTIFEAAQELGISRKTAIKIARQYRQQKENPEVTYAKQLGELVIEVGQVNPGDIVYDRLLDTYAWVVGPKGKNVVQLASGMDRWTAAVGNRLELARQISNAELIKKSLTETGAVGKLTPEQQAAEAEARAARSELYRRIGEAAKKTGKNMADAADDLGVGRAVYQRLATERRVDSAVEALGSAADGMRQLNERARFMLSEAENVAETGTLSAGGPGWRSESREAFREKTGPKPETYKFKISEKDIDVTRNQMVNALNRVVDATRMIEQAGDGLSVATAQVARATLQQVVKEANKSSDLFRKQRFAAGRMVKAYDRPPFSQDAIEALERVGVMVDGLRRIKRRLPIDTNIVNSIGAMLRERSWNALTPEQQRQLRADLVDTFRLNIFAPTSFTLDFVSNLVETSAQAISGLAGDMVHLAKGYPTFPAFTGMWRAIKNRRIIPVVEEGIGRTFGGEPMPGVVPLRDLFKTGKPGAFTERSNVWSAGYDTLKGTPMYAKGAVDTGFKRFSANAVIWREAFMEADKQGLRGVDRQNFVDNYWRELPQATADLAIEEANKAGFNRPLTKWEESFSRSKLAQLFIEAFGRWTFQFPRWAAEMLGYSPKLWGKFWRMESNPEEVMRYLTRTATGIGGVYLVDQMFYDRTDFNSMEYVDEEGNRKRLSGRDHLVLPLFLSAIARGDVEKATGALRYVSIPGARFVYGEGGLLGRLTWELSNGLRQGKFDTRSIRHGLEDSLNRMIPGQAVLAAIKAVFDPTIREGVGANIPGVSFLREPAVDLSTGEPLRPRQRVLGVEMPSVAGTPIPGAIRVMPEAQKLLSRYGLLTYRGPRVPIAGYRASEAPEEVTREWEVEFGKARNRILSQVIPSIRAAETRVTAEQIKQGAPFYERMRKLIQQRDSMAARHATNVVNQRHLAHGKLPRQRSIRERRGLEAYLEDYREQMAQ